MADTRSQEVRVGTSLTAALRLMLRAARTPRGLAVIAVVVALFALLRPALKTPIGLPVAVALLATLMRRVAASDDERELASAGQNAAFAVDTLLIGERAPYPTSWRSGRLHLADDGVRWTPAHASKRTNALNFRTLGVRCVATRAAEGRELLHVKTNVFRVLDLRDSTGCGITLAVPTAAVELVATRIGS